MDVSRIGGPIHILLLLLLNQTFIYCSFQVQANGVLKMDDVRSWRITTIHVELADLLYEDRIKDFLNHSDVTIN